MKQGVSVAVAAIAVTIAPLAACANQGGNSNQSTTSTTSGAPPGAERLTTQVKSPDGSTVANATFDFANGYATVTVEAGPNQTLTPGFHALEIHSVGKCEADFSSAGTVYQAPGHTGDPASGALSPLQVRPDGAAKLVTTSSAFTASDLRNSSGTALIIHQDANIGGGTSDSSKRVACGVIASASATTTSSTTPTTTSVTTVTTTTAEPSPSTSTSTSTSTVTVTPSTTYPLTTTPPLLPPR